LRLDEVLRAPPIAAEARGQIDAGKALAQHVQQSANTCQKEYRSDRKLNAVRDLIN
jgi:hypothetical protein